MKDNVYKQANGCLCWFGLIFCGVGSFAEFATLRGYLSGHPPKVYVNDQLVRDPSLMLRIGTCLFPLPFIAIGAFCLLWFLRARIELQGDGIVAYGLIGKPTFDARWRDMCGTVSSLARTMCLSWRQAAKLLESIPALLDGMN